MCSTAKIIERIVGLKQAAETINNLEAPQEQLLQAGLSTLQHCQGIVTGCRCDEIIPSATKRLDELQGVLKDLSERKEKEDNARAEKQQQQLESSLKQIADRLEEVIKAVQSTSRTEKITQLQTSAEALTRTCNLDSEVLHRRVGTIEEKCKAFAMSHNLHRSEVVYFRGRIAALEGTVGQRPTTAVMEKSFAERVTTVEAVASKESFQQKLESLSAARDRQVARHTGLGSRTGWLEGVVKGLLKREKSSTQNVENRNAALEMD